MIITYFKKHWIKSLIISLIFVIFMGRYQYKMPKRQYADFHINYYTGQRLLNGQSIYDVQAYRKDKIANFKYPPICSLIFTALAFTSERIAATSWFTFNYILLILFMYYAGRLIFENGLSDKQKNWVYFWSLFLTSRFYMQNFDEGQVNFLMMTTLLLGIYAAHKNRGFLGGLLIGLSILVKYMSAIFIPYFLFKRRFKLSLFILLSMVLFTFFPAIFLGWENNLLLQKKYLAHLGETSLDFLSLSDEANQSIFSMFIRLLSNHGNFGYNFIILNDYFLGILTGFCCATLYMLSLIKNKLFQIGSFNKADLSLLFICVAIFNLNAWMHAFIFLTFGYMFTIFYLIKTKFKDKIVLALVIFSFIMHSFTNSFLTMSWAGLIFEIYSFVTIGALILFIAVCKIKFYPLINLSDDKNSFF